jgi:16S rRNA processing protein RimM
MDGELKVDPSATDDPSRFEDVPAVYVGAAPHRVHKHPVATVRYQQTKRGTSVILGLDDVESRTDAEALAKQNIYAAEDDLELGEDEVFVHELVGLSVFTEEGDTLGTVANYMEMPAQDVFVVTRDNGEEAMLPAIEDFILEIDMEGGRLVVAPIEGLFE